jgi:hypothetical protein
MHIMNNLILPKSTRGWNNTLCNMLIKSNVFDENLSESKTYYEQFNSL